MRALFIYMLQCVAEWCSVLQRMIKKVVCRNVLILFMYMLQCVAVCCSALQCVTEEVSSVS